MYLGLTREKEKRQIDSAAEMLVDFRKASGPQARPNLPFKEVEPRFKASL